MNNTDTKIENRKLPLEQAKSPNPKRSFAIPEEGIQRAGSGALRSFISLQCDPVPNFDRSQRCT